MPVSLLGGVPGGPLYWGRAYSQIGADQSAKADSGR